ncbi:MAG TPA: TlpA disulfide reductase family protein [Magnetospirillaceae bacterium]|nr:TlpA disulfide reductase family protein [Magnetospirillaceae bacterium]
MRLASIALLALTALLGGCSPSGKAAPSAPGPEAAQGTPAVASRPWYADRFEALGFYVFPVPTDIPTFAVQPLAGGARIGPGDLRGRVTLLNFWATWCPPCREEMPSIENLHAALKGDAFAVVAVSVREDPRTVEDFLRQNPYTFPIYLDPAGDAAANYVTRGIPTTFILDKDARAIAAVVGARDFDSPEAVSLFRDLARR